MPAPAYRSYSWIRQDWRVLQISKGSVKYSDKCGSISNTTPTGKKRLCLPLYVIKKLLSTKQGEQILKSQINRKLRAEKGSRVTYHPEIARLLRELEKRSIPDIPKDILVKVKGSKLMRSKKGGIKIDKNLYRVICSDNRLKKKFTSFCKRKQRIRNIPGT